MFVDLDAFLIWFSKNKFLGKERKKQVFVPFVCKTIANMETQCLSKYFHKDNFACK